MLMPLVTAENLHVGRQSNKAAVCAGNDSVNTAQLLLEVCQIVHAVPIIARGEAVQVSS